MLDLVPPIKSLLPPCRSDMPWMTRKHADNSSRLDLMSSVGAVREVLGLRVSLDAAESDHATWDRTLVQQLAVQDRQESGS